MLGFLRSATPERSLNVQAVGLTRAPAAGRVALGRGSWFPKALLVAGTRSGQKGSWGLQGLELTESNLPPQGGGPESPDPEVGKAAPTVGERQGWVTPQPVQSGHGGLQGAAIVTAAGYGSDLGEPQPILH